MKSNIAVVQGPSGAGKTRTLRDKAIALAKIEHKILCVASSNVAVDTDANAVWDGLTPEERKKYKCLRLETNSAKKSQRLKKLDYARYTGDEGEVDKMPEYLPPQEAHDHPATRNSLDKICLEFTKRQEFATKAFKQYYKYNEVYKAVLNWDSMKRSNVPVGMTLDYRIWEISATDLQDAEIDYQKARSEMSEEEFGKKLSSDEISVALFDKSHKYRECIANYVAKEGKITYKERLALQDAVDVMTERVLKETHFLFTTASNCGGESLDKSISFEPTVIFCDEAGQISIPSLCVPLKTFNKWEGLFLFGDVQQLEPTLLSGRFNEFVANGKMSPLTLLATKGFENHLLDTQFRIAPAISAFPRTQFYDDRGLKDDVSVQTDNEVRQIIHEITKSVGFEGAKGEGTEYAVTDVMNGCSRVEINGTSLVNHANADDKMIDRLLRQGKIDPKEPGTIKPEWITILTYYQGQHRLLGEKIDLTEWTQEMKDSLHQHLHSRFLPGERE